MKKVLTLILSCILITVAAGCSCNKKPPETPPEGEKLPSIPDGVTLNAVAEGEIEAAVQDFSVKYQNSENVYIDFFKTYSAQTESAAVAGITRYEGKIYGDNASCENYADALGDLTVKNRVYRTYSNGITEEVEDVSTIKLRGERCSVVSDGYTAKRGGSVTERGSGLTGMYIDGYHGNVAPLDYMCGLYGDKTPFTNELENILKLIGGEKDYTADVRADRTKLYLYVCRNGENASPLYCFYLDTAAEIIAGQFDGGELTFAQTADIFILFFKQSAVFKRFYGQQGYNVKALRQRS